VPFIGIIVPNIVRFLVGRDYQTIVPLSMLMGAWLLLVADTIGRTVILPGEMPVATILTVVGGPFLIWLLWRQQFNAIK
jgi:iron complex transport system permease protein